MYTPAHPTTNAPVFEWDENKRQHTLAERGIDFAALHVLWDGRPTLEWPDARHTADLRYVRVGRIRGRLFVVVWTPRGAAVRLISARKANPREQRALDQRLPQVEDGRDQEG